jgi:cytochrome P450
MAFFHAMLLFPGVAKKVYEEIIFVTDGTRLPRTSDRAHLPFTEAVWKESIRWNPFIPVGVPHVNNRDEVINGYTLKAGTLINVNIGFVSSFGGRKQL